MTRIKLKIKTGHNVAVITGKDKGKNGKVLAVYPDTSRILVQGINLAVKHTKPTQLNPQGGKISKEMSIHSSNVMVLDPKVSLPSRVGFKTLEDGTKVRFSKRSNEIIDNK